MGLIIVSLSVNERMRPVKEVVKEYKTINIEHTSSIDIRLPSNPNLTILLQNLFAQTSSLSS